MRAQHSLQPWTLIHRMLWVAHSRGTLVRLKTSVQGTSNLKQGQREVTQRLERVEGRGWGARYGPCPPGEPNRTPSRSKTCKDTAQPGWSSQSNDEVWPGQQQGPSQAQKSSAGPRPLVPGRGFICTAAGIPWGTSPVAPASCPTPLHSPRLSTVANQKPIKCTNSTTSLQLHGALNRKF